MAEPKRIRLQRTKGWRMPADTVKVDRSTKWGNPHDWRDWREQWPFEVSPPYAEISRDDWCRDMAVQAFEEGIFYGALVLSVEELRGKNLGCWCKLCEAHQDGKPFGVECSACAPCHADVLGEIANRKISAVPA